MGLGPCHSAIVNRSGGGSARRTKSRPQGSEGAGFEGQESLGPGVATCPPGIRSNEAAALLDTQPMPRTQYSLHTTPGCSGSQPI